MHKVLLGIPVLNNLDMTRACLRHVVSNTHRDRLTLEIDVLVMDNGSSEDVAGLLRNEFSSAPFRIHYRKNPYNMGVAVAWNQILRFSPERIPPSNFSYDYYVLSNNDALVGPDWLQPMVTAMESDQRIGWISALENGSPVLSELVEAHTLSKKYRVAPDKPYNTEAIHESVRSIYSKWGGHDAFSRLVAGKLDLFLPFRKEGRSAVCFMVRPAMIEQLGFFDEDCWPVGVSEDLEYFLRIEGILVPPFLKTREESGIWKWKAGFCGKSIVHHNWCSTHQGKNFDGRKWDKEREKNWRKKFRGSKKYFTSLLP